MPLCQKLHTAIDDYYYCTHICRTIRSKLDALPTPGLGACFCHSRACVHFFHFFRFVYFCIFIPIPILLLTLFCRFWSHYEDKDKDKDKDAVAARYKENDVR